MGYSDSLKTTANIRRLRPKVIQCISLDASLRDKRIDINPTSLSPFDRKLLAKKAGEIEWPHLTFRGVRDQKFRFKYE